MNENAEQRPRPDDVVEQRSASSLIFQSLDAAGDVGTLLAGAAAWKIAAGSKASEQQTAPPLPEPSSGQKTE